MSKIRQALRLPSADPDMEVTQDNDFDYNEMRLANDHTSIGVEFELENLPEGWGYNGGTGPLRHHPLWSIVADGSLRGSCGEFKFNSPLKGKLAASVINDLYCAFPDQTLAERGSVRTSLHIHVNMMNVSVGLELNSILIMAAVCDQWLFSLTDESRPGSGYCNRSASLLLTEISELIAAGSEEIFQAPGRYYSINTEAVRKFGTLEFRHFATPATKTEAIKLINCCMRIKEAGLALAGKLLDIDVNDRDAVWQAVVETLAENDLITHMQGSEFTSMWAVRANEPSEIEDDFWEVPVRQAQTAVQPPRARREYTNVSIEPLSDIMQDAAGHMFNYYTPPQASEVQALLTTAAAYLPDSEHRALTEAAGVGNLRCVAPDGSRWIMRHVTRPMCFLVMLA